MYKRISYALDPADPGWPGNPKIETVPYSSIDRGDACNEYSIHLFNHFGSHIDGPKHVYADGVPMADLPADAFVFERPLLLDIPKSYEELVTEAELAAHDEALRTADLLLIRSGFSAARAADPRGYASRGPGVSASACRYLAASCPRLKGVALDWLSLSSYTDQEEGAKAHRHLLDPARRPGMVIIEDLDFAGLEADRLIKVIALPLLAAGADSGPCHAIAELEEEGADAP